MNSKDDGLRIVLLDGANDHYLDQVEGLFGQMYQTLEEMSEIIPLAPGGAHIWRKGIAPSLGRVAVLSLAVNEADEVMGFLHTTLFLLPDHIGGGRAARILNMMITEQARGRGLVKRMFENTLEWLKTKGVKSIESHIQVENVGSLTSWERLGFHRELYQIRLNLPPEP